MAIYQGFIGICCPCTLAYCQPTSPLAAALKPPKLKAMNGPKFRFTFVLSLLLFAWWAFNMVTHYLMGETGLNFDKYVMGVFTLGSAALAGFVLVWATVRIIGAIKYHTGFEANTTDEYGTEFRVGGNKPFAITLSKFLPQVVARPNWQTLSGLEAELFGFYNGMRHWPYDLANPSLSLPAYAQTLWQHMAAQTGAGPLHRSLALASCLGKVAAYREKRTTHPWYHVFARDTVSFSKKSPDHGGLAAFVLSTFPAFKKLGDTQPENTRQRRLLLTALKYRDDSTGVPNNADPIIRELLSALHRAKQATDAQLFGHAPIALSNTDAAHEVKEAWPNVLTDLTPAGPETAGTEWLADADAVRLDKHMFIIKAHRVLHMFSHTLSPSAKDALNLFYDSGLAETPDELAAHPLFVSLVAHGLIKLQWGAQAAHNGLFMPTLNGHAVGPVVLADVGGFEVSANLKTAPVWQGLLEHAFNPQAARQQLHTQAQTINTRIAAII